MLCESCLHIHKALLPTALQSGNTALQVKVRQAHVLCFDLYMPSLPVNRNVAKHVLSKAALRCLDSASTRQRRAWHSENELWDQLVAEQDVSRLEACRCWLNTESTRPLLQRPAQRRACTTDVFVERFTVRHQRSGSVCIVPLLKQAMHVCFEGIPEFDHTTELDPGPQAS